MILGLDPPGARMFACRTIQIVLGFIATIISAWLSLHPYFNIFWGVSAGCCAIVTIDGALGMFAFHRPRDLHWHVTLTFDWLSLVSVLFPVIISGLEIAFVVVGQNDPLLNGMIAGGSVAIWIIFLATIFAIVRTHRLKRQGKLLPPAHKQTDWVNLEQPGFPTVQGEVDAV